MKILLDALAATRYSGGMELHAREVIRSWHEAFPDDQLVVLAGRSLFRGLDDLRAQRFSWPNETIVGRAPGQLFIQPALAALHRVDYGVSLSPIVSPLVARSRSVCFQHDWRHLVRPDEFSSGQKLYRRLWAWSSRSAGLNICISAKAEAETLAVAPRARTVVVENGRDHARRWPPTNTRILNDEYVVTFGHHNNKRPELVVEAFSLLDDELFANHKLVVLGARGEHARRLARLAQDHGVGGRVSFPGFVQDSYYQSTISNAAAVVLASSDEGFGLPLAEAEYFGIPSVVSSDSGVASLFPEAFAADPTPEGFAEAMEIALLGDAGRGDGRAQWTWGDAVRAIRSAILEGGVAPGRSGTPGQRKDAIEGG